MRILLTTLVMVLAASAVYAQISTLSVDATAETEVPADRISFRIQMNAEADTPKEAYETHKKQEKVLVGLLREHEIQEEDIRFEPISIHKRSIMEERERKSKIVTNQQAVVELDDFTKYEQIQVTLIENNFNEFSGQFLSSQIKSGEDEALQKAIQTARQKAELIVGETGGTIAGIKNISYSYNNAVRPFAQSNMMEMRATSDNDGLLSFNQTVKVTATISIEYRIRQNN